MKVEYFDLKNKRVFISGGGSGIGATIVEHFCEQNSEVYFIDINIKASKKLEAKGISVTVADARFAKPIDEKLIMDLSINHEALITIEEGSIGGFGSHVMQILSERGVFDKGLKMRTMILPDKFLDQDTPEEMYKKAGLDCDSIVEKVENVLSSNVIIPKNKKLS